MTDIKANMKTFKWENLPNNIKVLQVIGGWNLLPPLGLFDNDNKFRGEIFPDGKGFIDTETWEYYNMNEFPDLWG